MDCPQEGASLSHDDDEVIRWTDDCIRWTEEENIEHKQEDDDAAVDIFKSNPINTFSFRFPRPNTENSFINIELQGYKDDSDEVWKSTGLTVWKASEHLCHYLVKHHDKLFSPDDKRILELGAGLGLVGIVAYYLAGNNSTVCLTDGDTDALVYLGHNVQHNTSSNTRISSHQLLWGRETAEAFLKKHNNKTFDIVFASDILYAECVIEPLWETVKILLSREGIFVMAFATRAVKVTIDDFIKAAKGFTCQCVEETDGVFVYEFRWKKE